MKISTTTGAYIVCFVAAGVMGLGAKTLTEIFMNRIYTVTQRTIQWTSTGVGVAVFALTAIAGIFAGFVLTTMSEARIFRA